MTKMKTEVVDNRERKLTFVDIKIGNYFLMSVTELAGFVDANQTTVDSGDYALLMKVSESKAVLISSTSEKDFKTGRAISIIFINTPVLKPDHIQLEYSILKETTTKDLCMWRTIHPENCSYKLGDCIIFDGFPYMYTDLQTSLTDVNNTWMRLTSDHCEPFLMKEYDITTCVPIFRMNISASIGGE